MRAYNEFSWLNVNFDSEYALCLGSKSVSDGYELDLFDIQNVVVRLTEIATR